MLESTEIRDGIRVLRVDSDVLDVASVDSFRAEMAPFLSEGPPRLVLELSRVEFMDSTGLSAVVGVHECLRGDGGGVALACPSDTVKTLLRLTSMDRLFPVVEEIESAREQLAVLTS